MLLGGSSSLLLLSSMFAGTSASSSNKVRLSSISSLTLYKDRLTTARRGSPIPQLVCVGPACDYGTADVMRCTAQGGGYDENDIQWTCTANLSPAFKLGSTDVSCEGYANPDDPYVLKGSCGVEYRLLFTELGEKEYGHLHKRPQQQDSNTGDGSGGSTFAARMFMLLFAGVLLWIAISFINRIFGGSAPDQPRPLPNHNGGGYGGNDDPPPPYDDNDDSTPRYFYDSSKKKYGSDPQQPSSGSTRGGVGPVGGAALGAAAAYTAGQAYNRWNNAGEGSSTSNRPQTGNQNPPQMRETRTSSWTRNSGNDWGSGSGSGGFSSSDRYESSGFGGTTRR